MIIHKSQKPRTLHDLPLATILIIAANVIVTLWAMRDFEGTVQDYGLIPSSLRAGRFIAASFIHDGFVHLAINMLLLYVFGSAMEKAMGRLEFALFYIGACLSSSLLHVAIVYAALPPEYATRSVVGASGAVAGVIGLYAVRYHRKIFKLDGIEISALFLIMVWLLVQIGLGVLALYQDDVLGIRLRYVAYWSHLGGFVFGILTALLANMALQGEREHLISEGKANNDQGNLLEAAQNYESLLKYDPDNALANAELGRLWAIMEEEGQSIPYYRNAVRLYVREGREDKAIAAAEEMKRYWPDFTLSPSERFRLATYLGEVGQVKRAIIALQEIADHSPDSNEAEMSLIKIGHLQLSALRDPAQARATLSTFLERYPESEWRLSAREMLERAETVLGT